MMVWGVNLSAVKVLTESLDVLLVAALRMVMAAVVLMFLAFRARGLAPLRGQKNRVVAGSGGILFGLLPANCFCGWFGTHLCNQCSAGHGAWAGRLVEP